MGRITLKGRTFEVAEASVEVAEALDRGSAAFDEAAKAQDSAAAAKDAAAFARAGAAAREALVSTLLVALRERHPDLTAEALKPLVPALPKRMIATWSALWSAAYLEDEEASPGEGVSR